MNIKSLVVHSKLKVHQLRVEPNRVRAIYTVEKHDGTSVQNELIYSYNKVYFEKDNWADINLASIMVAQVALNYGLFFEQIEFDGVYEDTDKRFLLDMMENTSREIYVLKFLHKNEFLKSPFDQIKAEKLSSYTAAKVSFVNTAFQDLQKMEVNAKPDKDQYAILSSGGKDSLLTYGIIKEIGTPHPVFINEAGRHWFSAVNAHNYFKDNEPNTAKPWCNSDRIFNWMVKQMPFIKENFQSIRADIYPIRLWTVSVFLFGVLPIARKRNLGNILIGNEYDTTVKGNYEGITHYNAIYDQSKYFDNYLTRYYQKKGWNINQYSILRSLSELLILKILVKRYPDLQRLQISCHAAHEEDGKMLPCGNCEKCRRIVGMLTALGEDPKRCGYTDQQIVKGLDSLSKRSVKQLGSDAAQLYYLLLNERSIEKNQHTLKLAKEHPEITKLRFDSERSKLEDLPPYIRKPIFDIYKKYSEGEVKLSERKWHNFDLDSEIENTPYLMTNQHENTI